METDLENNREEANETAWKIRLVFWLTWLLKKDIKLSEEDNVSLFEDLCSAPFDPVLFVWYSSAHLKN